MKRQEISATISVTASGSREKTIGVDPKKRSVLGLFDDELARLEVCDLEEV